MVNSEMGKTTQSFRLATNTGGGFMDPAPTGLVLPRLRLGRGRKKKRSVRVWAPLGGDFAYSFLVHTTGAADLNGTENLHRVHQQMYGGEIEWK
jgi:hypothetical protein